MRRKLPKRIQVCVEALEVRCLMTASTPIEFVVTQAQLHAVELLGPDRSAEPQPVDPSLSSGAASAFVGGIVSGTGSGGGTGLTASLPPLLSSISTSPATSAAILQGLPPAGGWGSFDRDAAFMDLLARNDDAFDRPRLPGAPPDDLHGGTDIRFWQGAFGGAFALGMPPGFNPRDAFRPNGPGDRPDWLGGAVINGSLPLLTGGEFRLLFRLFEARALLADAGLRPQPYSAESDGFNNSLVPQTDLAAAPQAPALSNAILRDKATVSTGVGTPALAATRIPSPASVSQGTAQNTSGGAFDSIPRHELPAENYGAGNADLTVTQPFARWMDAVETDEASALPESMATLQQYLGVDWPGLESRLNDFIAQLEAFGAGSMSDQSPQSYASLTWVSLMAVVTVVLELARRQNQVPALDQDAYGMLNDRSSARRRTAPGGPDLVP